MHDNPNINLDRIEHIANLIDLHPSIYDQDRLNPAGTEPRMGKGIHTCQTPCCIAGFTLYEYGNKSEMNDQFYCNIIRYASHLLGFETVTADGLFWSNWPTTLRAQDFDFSDLRNHMDDMNIKAFDQPVSQNEEEWFSPTAPEAADILRRFTSQIRSPKEVNP